MAQMSATRQKAETKDSETACSTCVRKADSRDEGISIAANLLCCCFTEFCTETGKVNAVSRWSSLALKAD